MATMNWTRRSFLGTLGAGVVASEFGSLTTLAQGQGPAPNPARDAANVERDVVFGKGGDVELHCDIYKPPAGASKRMAILHYHGGGFAGGNKNNLAARLQSFSALGYVNIAAQYRLAGVAKWPAQIEDVKAAIRWTRANASRLGIDPARIGVATKCTFCSERIDAGLAKGLKPGVDPEATPACVNSYIAGALHFGDAQDKASNVSQLLAENQFFRMHEELGTEPGFYYLWDRA